MTSAIENRKHKTHKTFHNGNVSKTTHAYFLYLKPNYIHTYKFIPIQNQKSVQRNENNFARDHPISRMRILLSNLRDSFGPLNLHSDNEALEKCVCVARKQFGSKIAYLMVSR